MHPQTGDLDPIASDERVNLVTSNERLSLTLCPSTVWFLLLLLLQENADDQTASDLAVVLFETATLRSGYQLADTKAYGDRIERMLRLSMNVDLDEQARRTNTSTHTHKHKHTQACTRTCTLTSLIQWFLIFEGYHYIVLKSFSLDRLVCIQLNVDRYTCSG